MMRQTALAILVSALCLMQAAQAQTNQPPALPTNLESVAFGPLVAERAALITQLETVRAHISAFNARCNHVRSDDAPTVQDCRTSQAAIVEEIREYRAALAAYETHLAAAPRSERNFIAAGNGFVGGTQWRAGYNVPPNASPEMRAHAREMLRQQARLAGVPYDEAVDFDRYNFVIGVATWTNVWHDLFARAATGDQVTGGGFSAEHQQLYNSLRGRQFDELGCHSNGAMVCLWALQHDDVRAGNVVLYGPQLTPGTIAIWNELLAQHRIQSLQILVNENDPVTPASLLWNPLLFTTPGAPSLAAGLFFNVHNLDSALHAMMPDAHIQSFPCGTHPTLDCHEMTVYQAHRGPVHPTP